MAEFLDTSATNYALDRLIKSAESQLVLISPYLKFNEKLKELLIDKDRQKLEIGLIFGKDRKQENQIAWLSGLKNVRVKYCDNLHAKCYLSEKYCIITSLNLHEFSQVNNNEMSVLITKKSDESAYADAVKEVNRIYRISEKVDVSTIVSKLTTSKLATKLSISTAKLLERFVKKGYLEISEGKHILTEQGREAGGESKTGRHGPYFIWPE